MPDEIAKQAGRIGWPVLITALMLIGWELAVKMLGIRLTEKAIAGKVVPLVGAGIGAAWNWVEVQAVGNRAVNYHLGLESRAGRARKKVASIVREARRKLPGPRRRP